ncbi:MAG: SRPBCC family protein, partial [Gammaproteobacteria bacterium]
MVGIGRGPAMRRAAILGAAAAGAAGLGAVAAWFLPAPEAPVEIHSETTIARAPAEVFDFVASPANWPLWHPSSLAVSGATDHPL